MDVTVNINAPAIVEAINRLSEVFAAAIPSAGSQVIQTADGITANVTAPIQDQNATQPQYEVIAPNAQQNAPTALTQPTQQTVPNIPQGFPNVAQGAIQPTQNATQLTAPTTTPNYTQLTAPAMTVNQPPQNVQQAAPAAVDEAYRSRVQNAAGRLIEQNRMPDLLALLQSFGVESITQLSAVQLPEFANRLVAMGATI